MVRPRRRKRCVAIELLGLGFLFCVGEEMLYVPMLDIGGASKLPESTGLTCTTRKLTQEHKDCTQQ